MRQQKGIKQHIEEQKARRDLYERYLAAQDNGLLNGGRITKRMHLPSLIGGGYGAFWRSKNLYLVCKGSRGSKKSCTTALKVIHNMGKYPQANTLVVRRYYNGHRDSTYVQLKWAIRHLGQEDLWTCKLSPLEITHNITGQKILFRGMDNPDSITSITVEHGALCWVWVEEAYQISDPKAFEKLEMSIRGKLPENSGLWKQFILTFNPWSNRTWIKERFFDEPKNGKEKEDVLAITTTYRCNEFLDPVDIQRFEWMRVNAPKRFAIEGDGNWGIAEGLIYENWEELEFDINALMRRYDADGNPLFVKKNGLDFGYSLHPTGLVKFAVSEQLHEIYIYDELYETGLTAPKLASRLKWKRVDRERIIADSEDPRLVDELHDDHGITRIVKAQKGPDSVRAGILKVQEYTMYVHPRCINTIIELNNYAWEEKDGKFIQKPIKEFDHIMDALRYGMEDITSDTFSFN